MSKRKALMVCGSRPDVRVGRVTEALSDLGWTHDVVCRTAPAQFQHVYGRITQLTQPLRKDFFRAIRESDAEVIHVHGELFDAWLMETVKEAADCRPIIYNCHDLVCSRPNLPFDPYEQSAYALADALVFVTPEQQAFATAAGLDTDKPTVFVTNYPSSSIFVTKPCVPHIGGVVYEGGVNKRGDGSGDRDLSAVADALAGNLHIYPGQMGVDYGIVHEMEFDYQLLIHRLAAHDWGFVGHPAKAESWRQTFCTKAGEYIAAGIPFIAIDQPSLDEWVALGMGVAIDDISDLPKAAALDPKPYRKQVLAHRGRFTTRSVIEPLADLYASLT